MVFARSRFTCWSCLLIFLKLTLKVLSMYPSSSIYTPAARTKQFLDNVILRVNSSISFRLIFVSFLFIKMVPSSPKSFSFMVSISYVTCSRHLNLTDFEVGASCSIALQGKAKTGYPRVSRGSFLSGYRFFYVPLRTFFIYWRIDSISMNTLFLLHYNIFVL